MTTPIVGLPGIKTTRTAAHRRVLHSDHGKLLLPGGKVINGTLSRDPLNTGDTDVLRAGMVMGKITASGLYAPSIIGKVASDYAGSTTLTVSAATAVEIVRRIGTTGTFKVTGAPTASGVVRTLTVTYSAVNTGNGAITVTALNVNEVQTLTFGAAATGGTLRLIVPKVDGTTVITGAITWDTTDATYLTNINNALNTATGVTGGIVATGAAPDTELTFTFSGTGFAANTWPLIQVHTFPTSTTTANVVRTVAGVAGAFDEGALIQPTDGSETLRAIISDGTGVKVTDIDGVNVNVPLVDGLCGGFIDPAGVVNWPDAEDTTLIAWFKAQIKNVGPFAFKDDF